MYNCEIGFCQEDLFLATTGANIEGRDCDNALTSTTLHSDNCDQGSELLQECSEAQFHMKRPKRTLSLEESDVEDQSPSLFASAIEKCQDENDYLQLMIQKMFSRWMVPNGTMNNYIINRSIR